MVRLFDNPRAFAPFKEEVTVRIKADGIAFSDVACRAVVVEQTLMDAGAGSSVHSTTGDSYAITVDRADWPAFGLPQFGNKVFVASEGPDAKPLVIQQVQMIGGGFVLNCTRNVRAEK